jgi:hypothetical protein
VPGRGADSKRFRVESRGSDSEKLKQKLFFRPFDKKKRIEWQSAIYGRREPPSLVVFDGIFLSLL